jgi:DNA-binding transcriptional ArsR family regulator
MNASNMCGEKVITATLHPNAYLKKVRNVRSGLKARTKILVLLDTRYFNAGELAKKSAMSYGVVMHHLRLLCAEGIVERKGSRRYIWLSTGFGQKRLV